MRGGNANEKPRRLHRRGFAQSTWWVVAFLFYRIGKAGAIALPLLLSLAAFGAGYGAALLWRGPSQ